MKRVSVLAACAVVGIAAAGCGSSNNSGGGGGSGGSSSGSSTSKAPAAPSRPFRILAIMAQSGPLGGYGAGELQGVKAAVKQINDGGGINGKPVKLEVKDDAGDPTKGVSVLQQSLSGSTKPDLVIPGITPLEGQAMVPMLTAAKVLSVTGGAGANLGDPAKYPYSFIDQAPYEKTGKSAAELMLKKGIKKVATIAPNDESSAANISSFKQTFEAGGGKVVAQEKFDPTALDLTSIFERAYASKPDALYVANEGQGVQELKAHQAAGVNIPLYGDIGFTADFTKLVPAGALKNAYGLGGPILVTPPAQRSPQMSQFWSALQSVGGDKGMGA